MDMPSRNIVNNQIEALYEEREAWHVNSGGETIHAKRVAGSFRRLKWLGHSFWLIFFFGPYLRWDDRQAVLFDIPNRQYHIFGATVLPQDFWLLTLTLLFFAMLLAVVTAVAGRVWCGYFCFQTVWTDVYTWIEGWIEGAPQQRRKLDQSPLSIDKAWRKTSKHLLWLVIAILTGVTFVAWFQDAFITWQDFTALSLPSYAWATIAVFTAFTYGFAGFMREQVCFWLCPYARIQGVMVDRLTVLPTYDLGRGEPRGRISRDLPVEIEQSAGDCIDCRQCVAVCPTGIDIRDGQQEGCITCGLCIDACNVVMDKVHRPRGLIRYGSYAEFIGERVVPTFRRPRVLLYLAIVVLSIAGIIYGLASLNAVELKVLHERQPLYVLRSDGTIQNRYTLKLLNKTDKPLILDLEVVGQTELEVTGFNPPITAKPGGVTAVTLFVRVKRDLIAQEISPISFAISDRENSELQSSYESIFVGPR